MEATTGPWRGHTAISDDTVMWRYMTLEKYLYLLTFSKLWFSRVDLVGDRFEGSRTHASAQKWAQVLSSTVPPEHLTRAIETRAHIDAELRKITYVNSWHECNSESMNMWKIYTDPNGVAIQTTYGDLKLSFDWRDQIYVNRVSYLNYAPDGDDFSDSNILNMTSSRPSFLKFEQEIRAMTILNNANVDLDSNPKGLEVGVNLQKLINKTVIRPEAAESVDELLQAWHHKYDLQKEIIRSEFEFKEVW